VISAIFKLHGRPPVPYTLSLPVLLLLLDREDKMDNFGRFIRSLDDSIRHLYCVGDANAKRHQDCKFTVI